MNLLVPFETSNMVIHLSSSPVSQQSPPVKKKEKRRQTVYWTALEHCQQFKRGCSFPSILSWRDIYEVSQNSLKLSLILRDYIFYLPGYNRLFINIFSSTYGQKAFVSLPNLLKLEFFFWYIFFSLQMKVENGKRKCILPGNHPHFHF